MPSWIARSAAAAEPAALDLRDDLLGRELAALPESLESVALQVFIEVEWVEVSVVLRSDMLLTIEKRGYRRVAQFDHALGHGVARPVVAQDIHRRGDGVSQPPR